MKLFLSSSKVGEELEKLPLLVKNKRAVLIPNALDYLQDETLYQEKIDWNINQLQDFGFDASFLNLRKYFGKTNELESALENIGLIWVRGGNSFVLREAMFLSGFDQAIKHLSSDVVYGGYSAGSCVASPTLKGLDLVDSANEKPYGMNETIWEGLNLVPYTIIPHYQSDHKESAAVEKVVEYYKEHHLPYKTLRDGEIIIVECH